MTALHVDPFSMPSASNSRSHGHQTRYSSVREVVSQNRSGGTSSSHVRAKWKGDGTAASFHEAPFVPRRRRFGSEGADVLRRKGGEQYRRRYAQSAGARRSHAVARVTRLPALVL